MWLRIITSSNIFARSSTLQLLFVPTAEKKASVAHIFQVTMTSLRLWRSFFRGKMNSSTKVTRLVYKSCRNDGTSALKLAEIMWKNKLVVIVFWFFIYEAGNFWNNPRIYFTCPNHLNIAFSITRLIGSYSNNDWFTDRVKVLHTTWHKIGHFGDVLPSQYLGVVLKKLNPTQQKQTTQEQNNLS